MSPVHVPHAGLLWLLAFVLRTVVKPFVYAICCSMMDYHSGIARQVVIGLGHFVYDQLDLGAAAEIPMLCSPKLLLAMVACR